MIGTTIAHYRVTAKLGEGGMGEVYRARDDRLNRDVAIKLLPTSVQEDPTSLARFRREAQVLASLTHGNIAQIYGLEEHGGRHAIVLELVEGEDLAERLARGPMALDDARRVALQIAAALETAHEKGIVHRDLKPANVKLGADGTVKVLDFGLAKALAGDPAEQDLSNSPTMTAAATQAGIILGTAAYMAPEQARGKPVDRRADVWAFGCLLYECLTGQRTFPGETISEILAEVIKSEPDWEALPADTPVSVRRLLRRCLVKDPASRLRDLGDAALDLVEGDDEDTPDVEIGDGTEAGAGVDGLPRGLAAVAIVGALALGFALGALLIDGEPAAATAGPGAILAGIVDLPGDATIAYGSAAIGYDSPMLTISTDGTSIVYVGRDGAGSRLYVKDLSTFDPPEPIPGTEGALQAFYSPFEPAVAFYTNDKLVRVDVTGDRRQVFGDVSSPTRLIWGDDRKIYLGDSQASILRVFTETGAEEAVYEDLVYHGLTDVLPGGGRILFHEKFTHLRHEFGVVKILGLASDEERVVLENAYGATVCGDRLFFIRNSALMAAPFDHEAGELTGEAEIVARDVAVESIFGQAQVALSASGTIAYLPGGDRALGTIGWVDRDGGRGRLAVEPRVYGTLDLSPDDKRIAVGVGDVKDYVWIYDIERASGRRLLSAESSNWPAWNAAGDTITYTESGDQFWLVEQKVDSRESPTRLARTTYAVSSGSWSPDDSAYAFSQRGVVVVDAGGNPITTIDQTFMPDWSPDGHWLVHGSTQADVYETVVRSWPDQDQVYSIQADGGIEPLWTANGELFWRLGDAWYVVRTTTTKDSFEWTEPEVAFEIPFLDTPGRSYVVTSDGQRLYTIVQAEEDVEDRIHVVSGLTGR